MHPIQHAQSRPDHPAVIMAGSGETMTFGEMDAEANRFAQLLRAHGFGSGDAFALLLENRVEFFTIIWGSQRAGTMLVPVSTRLTAPETAYILQDSGAKLLIASRRFDDVLAADEIVEVRKTANLHTGGTLHDVTAELHPAIAAASVEAARVLDIPVVGLDFIVEHPAKDAFIFIEANERPGLANHEPQPTAERFIDLLFPQTARRSETA